MKLTPLDIHQKEFRHVLRGYNEEEVDFFLDEVATEFERLFQENIDLKEQVERLQKKLAQYENFEQTLQDTMIAAQKSAEDIQNNAKRAGELIIRDAELKSKEMIQEAFSRRQTFEANFANLKKMADDFRDRLKAILEDYLKKLGEIDEAEAKLPEELMAAVAAIPSSKGLTEAVPFDQETIAAEQEVLGEPAATEEVASPSTETPEEAAENVAVVEEAVEPEVIEEPLTETTVSSLEDESAPSEAEPAAPADQTDALKEAMRKLREEAEAFGVKAEPEAEETAQAPAQQAVQEASPEATSSDIEEIS